MENRKIYKIILLFLLFAATGINCQITISQPVVGLGNGFNHETNAGTGNPTHYLRADTESSGYSHWGELFIT